MNIRGMQGARVQGTRIPGCCSQQHSPQHSRRPWQRNSTSAGALELGKPPLVVGPPPDYDHMLEYAHATRAHITRHHPELLDLVDDGSLLVHCRPSDYQERRTDGYCEPETVFILGTAHMSLQSARDATRVVEAVSADAVVVELCKSRLGLLHDLDPTPPPAAPPASQPAPAPAASALAARRSTHSHASASGGGGGSDGGGGCGSEIAAAATATAPLPRGWEKARSGMQLSGVSLWEAVARSLALGGQSGLLLRLLLANQAQRAATKLGVRGGEEFRAAARAADALGAQLVLGDRPIDITLGRAWGALTWRRRLQLCRELAAAALAPLPELDEAAVERLRSDDTVSSLFRQLGSSYPELLPPLVHERDLYLAWSLKRSKAVNGARAVVGVVGKGHLRGVGYALRHDDGRLRFSDLVGGANRRGARRAAVLRRVAWEVALGAALYAGWVAATTAGS